MHVYEQSGRMQFMKPLTGEINIDKDQFNAAVKKMTDRAMLDLEAEGLADRDIVFSVELDMLYGGQVQVKRVSSPLLRIDSDEDAQAIYDAFEKEFSEAFSPYVVNKPGGVYLDGIVVKATVITEKLTLPVLPVGDASPSAARTTTREAYWPELGRRVDTPVFSFDALAAGNVVVGPAIVEMDFSTIVVPPTQQLRIDEHGLGLLESVSASVDADSRETLEEVSA
jgi:N-methylhydantoinase A/acetophenone carboxylase